MINNVNIPVGQRTYFPELSIGSVFDSEGGLVPLASLPQTLTYAADILMSISVTDGTNTWVQSYSYTGANLTGISAWVKQ